MRLQHSQGDCFKTTHDTELQATACQAAVRPDVVHDFLAMQPSTPEDHAHLSSRIAPPACVQQSPAPRCRRAAGRRSGPPCWLCARTPRSNNWRWVLIMTCRTEELYEPRWLCCIKQQWALSTREGPGSNRIGRSTADFLCKKGGLCAKMPKLQTMIGTCPCIKGLDHFKLAAKSHLGVDGVVAVGTVQRCEQGPEVGGDRTLARLQGAAVKRPGRHSKYAGARRIMAYLSITCYQ